MADLIGTIYSDIDSAQGEYEGQNDDIREEFEINRKNS